LPDCKVSSIPIYKTAAFVGDEWVKIAELSLCKKVIIWENFYSAGSVALTQFEITHVIISQQRNLDRGIYNFCPIS